MTVVRPGVDIREWSSAPDSSPSPDTSRDLTRTTSAAHPGEKGVQRTFLYVVLLLENIRSASLISYFLRPPVGFFR